MKEKFSILKLVQKVPGGMMIVPLILGALCNSFIPQAIEIGGFTTALLKDGVNAFVAMFFVCSGSQIKLREAATPLARGTVLCLSKILIGAVIGPGGKVIQEIQKSTGTTITITEKDNKGFVDIFGENKDALESALARIKGIVAMPEVGEVYKGKIRSIVAFGAFVEILPGKDGLLHISEIANRRFETMEQTGLKEGDMIEVKLIGLDPKNGKLKLSRKALLNGKKE